MGRKIKKQATVSESDNETDNVEKKNKIPKKIKQGEQKRKEKEQDEIETDHETNNEIETNNEKETDEEEDTEDEDKNVDDSDESDEPEIDNSETLKINVAAYMKIDDAIREKKEVIKELLEQRCKCEAFLTDYLEKANKTKIETKDGEILFKKTSTKSPLKEELFEKAIVKKFQDEQQISESGIQIAKDILEEVNNMRDVKVRNNIKRIKRNDKKNKK